jgi:hypothetical protein
MCIFNLQSVENYENRKVQNFCEISQNTWTIYGKYKLNDVQRYIMG